MPSKCVLDREADPEKFREFLPEFQRVLQEIRPDVVHAGPVQSCAYIAALSGFHPLLVMPWGSDILFYANQNAEWKQAAEVALQGTDGLFCDCEAVWQAAQQFAEIPSSHVIKFPWGIKKGSFIPEGKKLTLEPGTINLICTRSWESLYDIDVLLEAFRLAFHKNDHLRLLLLGEGSRANAIHSFIERHRLGDVVRTPGSIPHEELPVWFRSADGYISCAKTDGTSVSLLEAMATGLPVVVTDIPSNREWITEDENGWLAPVGAASEFAEKIMRLAALDQPRRNSISKQNQRIVAERADWNQNIPRLLDFYEYLSGSRVK